MTKEKNKNGKKTALNEVLRGINKKFGKDSIKSGKDLKNIEKISSGVDAINKLLGGGFHMVILLLYGVVLVAVKQLLLIILLLLHKN